jgi:hypothetical protein
MEISRSFLAALAVLPFSFMLGLSLLRFAQGADRARAIVDAYLVGMILSEATAELFGVFDRIAFLPFIVVWGAANAWVVLELWPVGDRGAGFWRHKPLGAGLMVAGIALTTLFIALTTAPNNWDSQTYHLPRIEHWIQDGSLAFYPTSISRQNEMGPVAEILLLQSRVLGGSDFLYPLVQWTSMLCGLAAAIRITRQLGGNDTQCWIAALFVATLPIGILESTSTQNDYVVAALLACGVTLGLEALTTPRAPLALVAAAAAGFGLSGLTKPIGILFGAGFAIWFAVGLSLRVSFLTWLARAAAVGAVLALIAVPFGIRYLSAREAGPGDLASIAINGSFGIRQASDNLLRHALSNLVTGVPQIDEVTSRAGAAIASALSLDANRQDTSIPGQVPGPPPVGLYVFHEDNGPNPVHLLLVLAAALIAAVRWRAAVPARRWAYWGAWLAGILAFAGLLRFGNWMVRYHLPAFALAAPLVALAWPERWLNTRKAAAAMALLGLTALPVLLFNQARELVPLSRNRLLPLNRDRPSYLTQTRGQKLFVNQPQLLAPYQEAVEAIVRSDASQIGLLLGGDSWEYPLWRMIRDRAPGRPLRIEHVGLAGEPGWPLGPFVPDLLFWNHGDAPLTIEIEGRQFTRLGPEGPIAVYARIGLALN